MENKPINKKVKDPLTGILVTATPERVESKNVIIEKLIKEYGYPPEEIAEEFPIKKGSNKIGPADVVVFKSKIKSLDNIKIIIETKRKKEKTGLSQLKSYTFPTPAEGAVWFNGEIIKYYKIDRKPPEYTPIFKTWRNIPKRGQSWEEVGQKISYKDLIAAPDLKSSLRIIQNNLYSNSNLSRASQLGPEIIRLLFCKLYDEIYNSGDVKFKAGALEKDRDIANRIKHVFKNAKEEYKDVFDRDEKITLNNASIAYVVSQLENYSLLKTETYAAGDAFEVVIGPALRGERGQFFTPRAIVSMMTEIMNPMPKERTLDPACGPGGFLITALEHVWKRVEEDHRDLEPAKLEHLKQHMASEYFYGVDKEVELAKMAKAYMAIIGDGRGGIWAADSLDESTWGSAQKESLKDNSIDNILTNPPFGSKIKITNPKVLQKFDLGYKWVLKDGVWNKTNELLKKGQDPQVLFIEFCIKKLKSNGRAFIILPDGVLGNTSSRHIVCYIMDRCDILAVIDLPIETFLPSTGTKTSAVLIKKLTKPGVSENNGKIFMATIERVGHDKKARPVCKIDNVGNYELDKNNNKIIDTDVPKVVHRYMDLTRYSKNTDEYSKQGFLINKSDIKDYFIIPKYYDTSVTKELEALFREGQAKLISIGDLQKNGTLDIIKGHGIDSNLYGRGNIPYIRTSDIVNNEIRIDTSKKVSEELYNLYRNKQDILPEDILIVNDGGELIGNTAMITKYNSKLLIQGHIKRIRLVKPGFLDPYILMYLLNIPIVKRQIECKTFVQTTIPTLSHRLSEIILPVPASSKIYNEISAKMKELILSRSKLRKEMIDMYGKKGWN